MSDTEEQMKDFMIKKNTKGCDKDGVCGPEIENKLPDKQRAMGKEMEGHREDASRYLLLARLLNFLVIAPLALALIAGAIMLFIKILPGILYLFRQLLVAIIFHS
jgi:hypothetical protein